MRGISRKVAREVDRRASEELRIPSICLMENAARGAAEAAFQLGFSLAEGVLCVAGPGNNGGDALAVARHLAIRGIPARVALLPPRSGGAPPGDAGVQLAIVQAMGLPLEVLGGADSGARAAALAEGAALLVDGLFGTGLARALDGAAADCVAALDGATAPVLALDVPSGLDCDTGRPLGPCVHAACTVTFVERKIGFDAPGAAEWTGDVVVAGIGAPLEWPRQTD